MSTKHLVSAVAASILLSSTAFAAVTTETGSIKSLDATKHEIVLDTGKTFEAPKVDLTSFKAGQKVTISYDMKDGKMVAEKIEVAK